MALTAAKFDSLLGYTVAATETRYVVPVSSLGLTAVQNHFGAIFALGGGVVRIKGMTFKPDGAVASILLIANTAAFNVPVLALAGAYVPA